MEIKIDSYNIRARVLPVYLTITPIILLIAAILPNGLNLPLGGTTAVVFVPLAFLSSQLGADFGKQLERRLWRKWGGPPTTRFLRHSNKEFNIITRERVHEKLRAIGLYIPTKEEQEQSLSVADAHYQSCIEELIRRTRDSSKFKLVFKGLTEYGFRRNLLGLKPFGIIIAIVANLGCGGSIANIWGTATEPAISIVAGLLTTGFLFMWLIWVDEKAVQLAANRYARFLLEAALDLE